MEAQPMTENRANIVNNHIITCTISKHNHACCFACFDSNDSIKIPVVMEMADSSTHEASFCNLCIGSTPQHPLLSMVISVPIGTVQDDQQFEIRIWLFKQQAIFRVDFLVAENVEKILDTRGLGNLYYRLLLLDYRVSK